MDPIPFRSKRHPNVTALDIGPPITELIGCELGTIDYWESCYEQENANYLSHGDVGDIWFDEDSQYRIMRWMNDQDLKDKTIVDLGTGNGMMMITLKLEGYKYLTGIDYSPSSIELAHQIAKDRSAKDIAFKVGDILSEDFVKDFGQFEVVHDKGTYDAISLHPDNPKEMREKYIASVEKILKDLESIFIITSCNWTESELVEMFKGRFKMLKFIPAPSFYFGGKQGNVVTTMVFRLWNGEEDDKEPEDDEEGEDFQ